MNTLRMGGVVALACLGCGLFGAVALAQAADPCLAPIPGGASAFVLRDAKLIVRDVAGLNGSGGLPQTSVEVHGCAVLSGAGTPVGFQADYQAIVYSADGHQLQGGTAFEQFYHSDNPVGGVAHIPIADTIFLGYKIDHAKLAKSLTLVGTYVAPCSGPGQCASPVYTGTITVPACVVDGMQQPTADCPAQ
jgi:hypothetical protein